MKQLYPLINHCLYFSLWSFSPYGAGLASNVAKDCFIKAIDEKWKNKKQSVQNNNPITKPIKTN